ncbi:MAG: hypothetical protein AB7T32_06860 [Dehalococcoidia bacterium]
MISALRNFRGRLAISAALAVTLGVFALGSASTALAGPVAAKVSLSTSAGCSSKNGVATVKLTAKATATGGATINNVSISLTPGGVTNGNPTATVTINNAGGSYSAVITADGSSNDPVQYATITANGGSCSVRVTSSPPV